DDARHEHDSPRPSAHHRLDRGTRRRDRAAQVDRENAFEIFVAQPNQKAIDGNARVGDQDVEPAVALCNLGDALLDLRGVRNVELDGFGASAALFHGAHRIASLRFAVRVGQHHTRTVPREPFSDRATDAARPTGHQCHFAAEVEHERPLPVGVAGMRPCLPRRFQNQAANYGARPRRAAPFSAVRDFTGGNRGHGSERSEAARPQNQPRNVGICSIPAESPTLNTAMRLSMRLTRPASTLPGPISSACVTPASAIAATLCSQRTAASTWRTRQLRNTSGSSWAVASTLLTMGNRGFENATEDSAPPTVRAALAMREQWKGALTFSRTALSLRAVASSTARVTAGFVPEMTTCEGALKFAGSRTSSWRASW